MLSRNPEGLLCLEDGEGLVVLDMEDAVSPSISAEVIHGVIRRR